MNKRFECVKKTTYTKDGVRVEGHDYVTGIAFLDTDSQRKYFVDRCDRCGHYLVVYSDNPKLGDPAQYKEYIEIGGGENEDIAL